MYKQPTKHVFCAYNVWEIFKCYLSLQIICSGESWLEVYVSSPLIF